LEVSWANAIPATHKMADRQMVSFILNFITPLLKAHVYMIPSNKKIA
jgi:hypothetical protein